MEKLDYNPRNFAKVRVLLRTQNANPSGTTDRVVFNSTHGRFEVYHRGEKMPEHEKFDSVVDAIDVFNEQKEAQTKILGDQEDKSLPIVLDEPAEESFVEEETPVTFGEVVLENDDPEVVDIDAKNLETISQVSRLTNDISRQKLLGIVSELFKVDIIAESDILKTVAEHAALKKILSLLLDKAGVSITRTIVSHELKVSTGVLTFNPQIEYSLDDYRLGASQAVLNIARVGELQEEVNKLEAELQIVKSNRDSLSREIGKLNTSYAESVKAIDAAENGSDLPSYYIIKFRDQFITIDPALKAKPEKKGDYILKNLSVTNFQTKATKFSHDAVAAQMSRIFKNKHNIKFADLKQSGEKQMLADFTVLRVLFKEVDVSF